MEKCILGFIFLFLSGVIIAQENLKVSYSYNGSGKGKIMSVILTNNSDELMVIHNDDGTGMGSLLQFVFLDDNGQETGFSECNFNVPYSEYKRLIKIAPHSSMTFKYNLGSLREMGKKKSQLGTSVKVSCCVHYLTASQKKVGKPYKDAFIITMGD